MAEPKFYSPLKIGLLIVTLAYFLFTFHAMFTLAWIGEWENLGGSALGSFWIFVTDISASIGLVFRLIAGIIAVAAIIFYFAKKGISKPTAFKVLRWILVLEAIYWLGLLVSGVWGVLPVQLGGFGNVEAGLQFSFGLLITTGIPCLVAAIGIPIALFKLASELKPNKPLKGAIKWGLIAGIVYIFVFWLNNTGIWLSIVTSPTAYYIGAENSVLYPYSGIEYVTRYPDHILSFGYTTIGLLAVALYAAYFTKKSLGSESWRKLDLRKIGAIITAVGLYFLLIYVMWLVMGTDNKLVLIQGASQVVDVKWSGWYAWFLGHNLDLWMLALPLVGLPLLFSASET